MIGVVWRTGAENSSFGAALMRVPGVDGEITLDDIRVKEINIQAARRRVSVLAPTPVLFSGSLRKNLEGQLDHEPLEYGANVSAGEGS